MPTTVYLVSMWVRNNLVQCKNHVPNNRVQPNNRVEAFQNLRFQFLREQKAALSSRGGLPVPEWASRIPDCCFPEKENSLELARVLSVGFQNLRLPLFMKEWQALIVKTVLLW